MMLRLDPQVDVSRETTPIYVVEQMTVFDDDVVRASKSPLCAPSMSAFDLSRRQKTTKLLLMRSEGLVSNDYY